MQYNLLFILLISLTYIQIIFSIDDEQIPSLEKSTDNFECLSKLTDRNRRASISRPYFQHFRLTRDNNRYSAKNPLAFSPRLGKRDIENKVYTRAIDLNHFLDVLTDQLEEKQIDIVYEDSTIICFSKPINDLFIQQVLDKSQTIQDKREVKKTDTVAKHPVIFRYRLG